MAYYGETFTGIHKVEIPSWAEFEGTVLIVRFQRHNHVTYIAWSTICQRRECNTALFGERISGSSRNIKGCDYTNVAA